MIMDTLAISKSLQAATLPPAQADAIASAIGTSIDERAATKADIQMLRGELGQLEARLDGKLSGMKAQLLTWFVGTQVAVGALIVAFVQL